VIDRERPAVRVVVQPYATALPLGCFAFGIGNAILAAFTAHWIPEADTNTVALMMLAFVAPLELIPCIIAFLSRDTGSATAMGIFAGSWVVLGVQLLNAGPEAASPATGMFLMLLALCLAILAAGTFSGKPLIGVLFCVAMLRSLAAGLLQLGFTGAVSVAAAALGFVLAALAFYCGFGLLMEDILQRPLAMMFRSGKAKTAMIASLDEQLENVAREAGVRQQL
jgi:succinate-acetate transporter protein